MTIFDDIGNAINGGINEIKNWVYDTVAAGKNEIISFKTDAVKSITDGVNNAKNDAINSISKGTMDLVNSSKDSILKTVSDARNDLISYNTYEITQLKNSFANDIYGMKNQLAKDFKLNTTAMIDYSNNEINKVKSTLITTVQDTSSQITNLKNGAISDSQLQINLINFY